MVLSFDVLWSICRRTWLQTLRRPVALTFSLAQPMIWMLLFGFLFQRFPLELDLPGIPHTDFLVPGICGMTILFGASQAGISLIRDMQTGFLGRLLATPANHRLILGGKVAGDCLRLLAQALAVLLLGLLVGARLRVSLPAFLPALVCLGLFGAAFASLSCLIALAGAGARGHVGLRPPGQHAYLFYQQRPGTGKTDAGMVERCLTMEPADPERGRLS